MNDVVIFNSKKYKLRLQLRIDISLNNKNTTFVINYLTYNKLEVSLLFIVEIFK